MTDQQSLNTLQIRTLTHVAGNDAGGRGGRTPVTNFASGAQGLLASAALQPEDVGVIVATAAQGAKADAALPASQLLAALTTVASLLPTIEPTGTAGLWINGGFFAYSKQGS